MSDAVFISGLALHAYHGVMQHEAKVGQTFTLDLMLDIDLTEASRSDKLAHTVADEVVAIATRAFAPAATGWWRLPQALSPRPCSAVFPLITSIRVTVHKPHAPIAATFADVGVSLIRSRRSKG